MKELTESCPTRVYGTMRDQLLGHAFPTPSLPGDPPKPAISEIPSGDKAAAYATILAVVGDDMLTVAQIASTMCKSTDYIYKCVNHLKREGLLVGGKGVVEGRRITVWSRPCL